MTRRRESDAPIFLVGFMGVGKSTVGRALAARLSWAFADTDAMIEQHEGRAIDEIFRMSGEGRFRELEWGILSTFHGQKRVIVATGGGLFLGSAHRAFVKAHGISCWLDAPLHVIDARVPDAASRPLFAVDDPLSRRAFFERRRAAYALADLRVDAATTDPDDCALAVEHAKNAFYH